MRSFRLLALVVLAVVLVLSSTQGAFATIISASLDPECGPPGTPVELTIRFTGSRPTIQTYPDLGPLGGDIGEGIVGYDFTVPDGVHQITITIIQDGAPSGTVTFCPSPVGGVVMPTNTFTIVVPWLALIGLVGCIGTVAVIARKREK
jgi:hypothetical protein